MNKKNTKNTKAIGKRTAMIMAAVTFVLGFFQALVLQFINQIRLQALLQIRTQQLIMSKRSGLLRPK